MHFSNWPHYKLSFIRQRYNSIASFFLFLEWMFLLPPGIRSEAVDCLKLKPGDRVLEIGCGTGRNLSLLHGAVGPEGHIYGVDLSEGMLSKARQLCMKRRWSNVTLTHSDAADYVPPESVDGVIFSLSYATMPHHKTVYTTVGINYCPERILSLWTPNSREEHLGRYFCLIAYGL